MRRTNKIALAAGAAALAGAIGLSGIALADHGRGRDGGQQCSHHGKSHHGKRSRHHGWNKGHMRATMMERFDADKDGKLTQEELDQSRKDLLASHDGDKDGKLSLEEFKALWLEVMQRRVVRGFQRIDTDGDAGITVEEFLKPFSQVVERMDRNDDGVLDKEDSGRRHHHRHHGGDDHGQDKNTDQDKDAEK